MHFNENARRNQAFTKAGKAKFNVEFPKAKKGDYIVRPVKESQTYGKLLDID